jgi:hypothetical protein
MADTEQRQQQQPLKTYRGNCHCGAFVYEADLPEITSGGECNCSICVKKGYVLVFLGRDKFRVVKGSEDQLTVYAFGTRVLEHLVNPDSSASLVGILAGELTCDIVFYSSAQSAESPQWLGGWTLASSHLT